MNNNSVNGTIMPIIVSNSSESTNSAATLQELDREVIDFKLETPFRGTNIKVELHAEATSTLSTDKDTFIAIADKAIESGKQNVQNFRDFMNIMGESVMFIVNNSEVVADKICSIHGKITDQKLKEQSDRELREYNLMQSNPEYASARAEDARRREEIDRINQEAREKESISYEIESALKKMMIYCHKNKVSCGDFLALDFSEDYKLNNAQQEIESAIAEYEMIGEIHPAVKGKFIKLNLINE